MSSCTCIFLCVYNIDLYSKYSKLKKGQKPSSNVTQDDGNRTRSERSHTPVKKVGSRKDRSMLVHMNLNGFTRVWKSDVILAI